MVTALMVLVATVPGQQAQAQAGVKKGEKAPFFKLDYIRDDRQFDLATAIASGKPTVVVFGSYT